MFEGYLAQFFALADGIKLHVLMAMIACNFLVAVAVSIATKTFRLKALGDFLLSRILPYILSYSGVVVVAIAEPTWKVAITIIWGIIILSLVGAIAANLKELGINLPDSIAGNKPQ